jgi:uncharacterized membrane protein YgcG
MASRGVSGGVFLEKGFSSRAVVTLPHFLQLQRPFSFEFSMPLCIHTLPLSAAVVAMASLVHPERFQSEVELNLVRNLLGWSAPAFAERIRAGATPLGDLACGLALPISPFFLLLLEEFGLQLQHLTPHSILQAAIFAHLCEMFVGVAPYASLFRYFFVLVKSRKSRDHLGTYYFQTRPDSAMSYISTLGGARWENWRIDWVIVSADANDRLVLSSNGPTLDRKLWRTQPSLSPELLPMLDRIETLATGGLTSMHVVGDFLKRRTASLQERPRLSCWFTDPNDICRIQRGPGTDLTWEGLEVLVKGITGESFMPKSLILPQNIPSLCDDPALRTAMLASLPTLDESGVAVRQTGGWDPHHGIRIPGASAAGPQLIGVAPSATARASSDSAAAPCPLDKSKGAASSFSARGGAGGGGGGGGGGRRGGPGGRPPPPPPRRKRGGAGCAVLTGRLFRTPQWDRGGRLLEASEGR